jgi:hypothetical protein
MNSKEVIGKLREFEATPCYRLFKLLCDTLIEEARLRNDTAIDNDIYKNQGAIAELKTMSKLMSARQMHATYDGGYSE